MYHVLSTIKIAVTGPSSFQCPPLLVSISVTRIHTTTVAVSRVKPMELAAKYILVFIYLKAKLGGFIWPTEIYRIPPFSTNHSLYSFIDRYFLFLSMSPMRSKPNTLRTASPTIRNPLHNRICRLKPELGAGGSFLPLTLRKGPPRMRFGQIIHAGNFFSSLVPDLRLQLQWLFTYIILVSPLLDNQPIRSFNI
jgi:hypothetical protein